MCATIVQFDYDTSVHFLKKKNRLKSTSVSTQILLYLQYKAVHPWTKEWKRVTKRETEKKKEEDKGTIATEAQHYFTKPIIHRAITQTDIVHFKKKHRQTHTHTHSRTLSHTRTKSHISVWFVLILWVGCGRLSICWQRHQNNNGSASTSCPPLSK